jgi:hypothetical protein
MIDASVGCHGQVVSFTVLLVMSLGNQQRACRFSSHNISLFCFEYAVTLVVICSVL